MGFIFIDIVKSAFTLYYYMMIFYILSSWIPALRMSQIGVVVGRLVEPYLSVFRRFIPPIGMIDLSPIVAFIAFGYLQRIVLEVLYHLFRLVHLI